MRHFSIFEFEDYVPKRILQRGRRYYKEHRIREMDELEPGHWYADAYGTAPEPYEVFVQLNEHDASVVEDYHCSCPYELGMCKHVVAFLYELRELINEEREARAELESQQDDGQESQTAARAEVAQQEDAGQALAATLATEAIKEKARRLGANAEEWVARYELLEPSTRRVWEVLAMFWSPIDLRRLRRILDALPVKKELKKLNLEKELELLQRLGMAGSNGVGSYWVAEEPGHVVTELLFRKDNGFGEALRAIRKVMSDHQRRRMFFQDEEVLFREMRFARYENNVRAFQEAMRHLAIEAPNKYGPVFIAQFWLGEKLDHERLKHFPKSIRSSLALLVLTLMLGGRLPINEAWLEAVAGQLLDKGIQHIFTYPMVLSVMLLYYFSGIFDPPMKEPLLDLLLPLQRKAVELIRRTWQEGLDAVAADWRELIGDPYFQVRTYQYEMPWLGYVFAFLVSLRKHLEGGLSHFKEALYFILTIEESFVFPLPSSEVLDLGFRILLTKEHFDHESLDRRYHGLNALFIQLFKSWSGMRVNRQVCAELAEEFARKGMKVWEAEARRLCAPSEGATDKKGDAGTAAVPDELSGIVTLAEVLRPRPAWEVLLERLEKVAQEVQATARPDERIVWFFDPVRHTLEPRCQKISVRTHKWTKGRRVSVWDLGYSYKKLLLPEDRQLLDATTYKSTREINLNKEEGVLRILPKHPHIYLAEMPELRVQFEYVEATLFLKQTDEGYRFRLTPDAPGVGIHLVPVTRTHFLIVEVPEALEPVLSLIKRTDPVVPPEAGERLDKALEYVRVELPILKEDEVEDLRELPADSRIHLHLTPSGPGFHIDLMVRPFGSVPPVLPPAEGDALVLGTIEGERVRCRRELEEEQRRLQQLFSLPSWQLLQGQDNEWTVPDTSTCLALLHELTPLVEAGEVVVEWPEGGQVRVTRQIDIDNFRMRVAGTDYWLRVEGEVQVDEERLMQLVELLELTERQGRFIELSPGEFVALTERLARQLKRLKALAEKEKNELRVTSLGALALEELIQEGGLVETDEFFRQTVERAREAFAKDYELPPPDAFTATLRPYQREGYVWLRRLADWGVGACLADDMGLGKTVQALALMSVRAAEGPQLVVAPASVCRNWVAETKKFAPALRPLLFGEGNRKKMIEEAGPGDLVIVTYDLMARQADLFASRSWTTILLDEAQAIKNWQTNRSRAAMRLKGDFKIIMTGTPVENHLGELWNLFHFINPGLLGSRERFRRRFALPIEAGDEVVREQLQRLVRPFILRRRKDEVLKDLPEKTEIVLDVKLSKKEQTFYEALRLHALKKLSDGSSATDGQKRIQILAELMRLRLAACHPRLVDPKSPIAESSKIKLFSELIEELVEGGHKALVFSQFVKHLKLLEEVLQAKGIAYQYLDGQTPPKVRQQRIEAFQRGEGDVFLISLKAGGTGLNLTAADYVIHMDPWWNPAVEDQATDRAHRIGQERPVTVYRLVAAHTIEEKILKLHDEKRDLADALLAGTDASARLSLDELMELLQE